MTNEQRAKQMEERNAAICAYYKAGHKVRECASKFQLGRMRIVQILTDGGVWKPHEKGTRTKFIGVNVSEETKSAVEGLAKADGKSVSGFVSEKLDELARVSAE